LAVNFVGARRGSTTLVWEHCQDLPRTAISLHAAPMFGRYSNRSVLSVSLMVVRSLPYNSMFFTFGLILSNFYHVAEQRVGFYAEIQRKQGIRGNWASCTPVIPDIR